MSNNFSKYLIDWYNDNKRDLPWRNTQEPYLIWVSEIILQQTRVNQGLDYYYNFIRNFPDVYSLSRAQEQEVLRVWQGLGYYSRARNMHKASKIIVDEYKGVFPSTIDAIKSLPGIGDYTASAIASFSFNMLYAVLDGNVFRVLSRYFGIDTPIDTSKGKSEFQILATQCIDKNQPSIHNQAIMEFGALQCVPVNPHCDVCRLNQTCHAYQHETVVWLPVKSKKTKVRNRYFNYLVVKLEKYLIISQRKSGDIWEGLFEFPLIEADQVFDYEDLLINEQFLEKTNGIEKVQLDSFSPIVKHKLSHQNLFARFFYLRISNSNEYFDKFIKVEAQSFSTYPLPKLIQTFTKYL
jgi:A/G-specific adenine glycosylase